MPDDQGCDDRVIVECVNGEVTEQMRMAYDRFWQLLIGRLIEGKSKLKRQPPKPATKNKKHLASE
jgi:hypothetical protein